MRNQESQRLLEVYVRRLAEYEEQKETYDRQVLYFTLGSMYLMIGFLSIFA